MTTQVRPPYPSKEELDAWARRQGHYDTRRNLAPARRWPSPVRVGAMIWLLRRVWR